MDIGMLDGIVEANASEGLGLMGVHLHISGKGSTEARFFDDERTHIYSGSKAYASMAVGIALEEGRFLLEDKALSFFPEYAAVASEGAGAIRVKDLLQMRAGCSESLFSSKDFRFDSDDDWTGEFFRRPCTPGAFFFYDNGCTYILSRIIEKTSGQTLRDYLVPRLFTPMGVANPQWHSCHCGHTLGAVGLYLTTEEFSRLGILMLQGGLWEGKRLVSESYIKHAHEDLVEVAGFSDSENRYGYGYQLWRCSIKNSYRADGKYGQYSIVLPDQNAVITATAHNEGNACDILRSVWKLVLPRL
ncbi:MAG: beta-lactamase family protein [Clostridiales bacterium]|nr:beta-lactamase family protein [Clostridiales bacterium]